MALATIWFGLVEDRCKPQPLLLAPAVSSVNPLCKFWSASLIPENLQKPEDFNQANEPLPTPTPKTPKHLKAIQSISTLNLTPDTPPPGGPQGVQGGSPARFCTNFACRIHRANCLQRIFRERNKIDSSSSDCWEAGAT